MTDGKCNFHNLSPIQQEEIIQRLYDEKSRERLFDWVVKRLKIIGYIFTAIVFVGAGFYTTRMIDFVNRSQDKIEKIFIQKVEDRLDESKINLEKIRNEIDKEMMTIKEKKNQIMQEVANLKWLSERAEGAKNFETAEKIFLFYRRDQENIASDLLKLLNNKGHQSTMIYSDLSEVSATGVQKGDILITYTEKKKELAARLQELIKSNGIQGNIILNYRASDLIRGSVQILFF
ncbi:MAG: hypothetical protein G8345_15200 [Magnetococcales bacterium]|nr:hypothetical protein [Magnetococcales bacterium]